MIDINFPTILFHGYKNFEAHFRPNINHPLWTGELNAAIDYIGETDNSGLSIINIDAKKIVMFDMHDIESMKTLYGEIGEIISQYESFYSFILDLYEDKECINDSGVFNLRKMRKIFNVKDIKWLNEASKDFIKTYNLEDLDNIDQFINYVFFKKILNAGFNCIIEHENDLMNYVLLTDEMIDDIIFIEHNKCNEELFAKLSVIDIYDNNAQSVILQIVN